MIKLAYGMPGAGKSTLLHDLIRAEAHCQRFFINAHSLEWHPEAAHWRGQPPPSLRVIQGLEELEELAKDEELPDFGVFVFMNVEHHSVVNLVVSKGWSTYVDDEIDLIARRVGWEDSPLRQIVHQGRHLENEQGEFTECHILGAARRPQNLCTDLTELSDEFYVFRLKGSNTKKRLLADNILETEEEWEELRNLPDFHCKFVGLRGTDWRSIKPLGRKVKQVNTPK